MNAREELVERISQRRCESLPPLSEAAYQELVNDVRSDLESAVETESEQALLLVAKALDRHNDARDGEDLLDDEAFLESRSTRLRRLVRDCENILLVDETCLDARLLAVLASDQGPDETLGPLLDLENYANGLLGDSLFPADAWDNIMLHPYMRVRAAVVRTCLDSARYRMAASKGDSALMMSASDPLGIRHSCALAYARLEDELAFESIEQRFPHMSGAWEHLAHTILLYKLGRMPAARRALRGYVRLCEGGAYALLKPMMVDTYLPDRDFVPPFSFQEATQAVHEADPIICDVPDFISWAQSQRDIWFSAESFAQRFGFDW